MKKIYYLIAMAVTAFTFTSCEDVPEPFGQPINPNAKETVVVEPTGSGTEADPYNVAKVTEVTKAMADGEVKNDVYTKGYVCQIDEIDTSGSYGNSTYWISDDPDGKSGKYEVYRGVGLGGQKFNEAGATIIKVGDAVIIKGNIKNFKGTTPEYDSGSIIVELNGVKAGGGGDTPTETIGTKDAPLTIAQALEKINALGDGKESELNAYVKGKVVKVTTNQTNFEKFGNLNYLISEDGTENNTITVYSGDGLNGAKFTGIDALAAGDEVIVFGKLYKYVKDSNVTPEIAKGNYLVSLKKASGGGGSTGGDVKSVSVADFLAAAESTDVWYQITGTVKNMKEDGSDLYGNFDIEDATGSVYVYGLLSEKGGEKKKFQELVAAKGIKNGSKITIIGNRGAYKGTAQVTNAYFVKIEDGESGGNDGVQTISVANFLAAAESTDVWYQLTGTVKNMKEDGSDLYGNFDIEDATGSVYVYGLLSEKGGAKKKFQELIAAKGIANGKKITIIGNRGAYKGTAQVTNAYFVSIE